VSFSSSDRQIHLPRLPERGRGGSGCSLYRARGQDYTEYGGWPATPHAAGSTGISGKGRFFGDRRVRGGRWATEAIGTYINVKLAISHLKGTHLPSPSRDRTEALMDVHLSKQKNSLRCLTRCRSRATKTSRVSLI